LPVVILVDLADTEEDGFAGGKVGGAREIFIGEKPVAKAVGEIERFARRARGKIGGEEAGDGEDGIDVIQEAGFERADEIGAPVPELEGVFAVVDASDIGEFFSEKAELGPGENDGVGFAELGETLADEPVGEIGGEFGPSAWDEEMGFGRIVAAFAPSPGLR